MVQHYILQRVPVVGKPVQRTEITDFRIRDMVWEPAHPINKYTFLPEWRDQPFKYKFDSERRNKFRRLLTSPFINDEVNLLTEELLEKSTIAKDVYPTCWH